MKPKSLLTTVVLVALTSAVGFGTSSSAQAQTSAASGSGCQAWEGLGAIVDGALDNKVEAIATRGKEVFIGGAFLGAGDDPNANYVARWDGQKWHALGSGLNNTVSAIATTDGDVYVSGNFTNAGGNPDADGIARWDGERWHPLGKGISGYISSIAVSGTQVYVGGNFRLLGEPEVKTFAAVWDGRRWTPFGQALNGVVYAVAVGADGVYLGGDFTTAGSLSVNRIVRWDGAQWHPLGKGFGAPIHSILVDGRNVYVGGEFDEGDLRGIAVWDGERWKPLGNGLRRLVNSLTLFKGRLYATGDFEYYDSQRREMVRNPAVMVWDGRQWRGLEGAPPSVLKLFTSPCCYRPSVAVLRLVSSESGVLVGGNFVNLGGNPKADYLAQWDGRRWQSLGESKKGAIDGYIFSIATEGESAYFAGQFTLGGGLPQGNNVVRWNGSQWQALGQGVDGTAYVVFPQGGEVIVGGRFRTASGVRTSGGARWNGKQWRALDSNLGSVLALARDEDDNLYAGTFDTVLAVSKRKLSAPSHNAETEPAQQIYRFDGQAKDLVIVSAKGRLFVGGALDEYGIAAVSASHAGSRLVLGKPGLFVSVNGIVELAEINVPTPSAAFQEPYFSDWTTLQWRDHVIADVTAAAYDGNDQLFFAVRYPERGTSKFRVLKHTLGSGVLEPVGAAFNGRIDGLVMTSDRYLIAAGSFTKVAENDLRYIAQWDGKQWIPLGNGLNGAVSAVALTARERLIIAGEFTNAGGDATADRVATCRLR